ncbi:hypothetical protein [Streptomyces sp. CA-256286]|uniref:hypothetical protein n=1 Tax=Streptomyces sp. CA-256286 TaxID=2801033 RepID=UPI001BB7BBDF|nr:hypothetical protein [Streptomyces sp. CA-256286]QTA36675.1 hypothetical protein JHY03_68900 [Streptomyces sp. CA-256286]
MRGRLLTLTLTLWEAATERRGLFRQPSPALDDLRSLLAAVAEVCAVYQLVLEHGLDEERRGWRSAHLDEAPPGPSPGPSPRRSGTSRDRNPTRGRRSAV